MILLNFAHPLTVDQSAQLATLLGEQPEIRMITMTINREQPLAEAALELVEAAGLTPVEWQTVPLLINPPSLAPLALALIADVHGRCGYFPPILNVRPVNGTLPPRYELSEIVPLQTLRDQARHRRAAV